MERVLELYSRPYDAQIPVVCLDETSIQLIDDARSSYMSSKGVVYQDFEYVRKGVCTLYMITEPLGKRREVEVRGGTTGHDYASVLTYIAEQMYPEHEKICLVEDNLRAHNLKFLYQIHPPQRAFAIARKFTITNTPKHGSWLNIAECEISVMKRQALGQRVGSSQVIENQVKAWAKRRNEEQYGVDWQFSVENARNKLKRLYPEPMCIN